jgi:hypothetical protein
MRWRPQTRSVSGDIAGVISSVPTDASELFICRTLLAG